ncbi:MAG: sacsin N-terminal ATP-binding-like domain-containing protein [Candidatus Xenobiia bacterium LiM19]
MHCDYALITKDNIRRRGEEFEDQGRFISKQLYTDRTHFVYELLQNAEDAIAFRVNNGSRNGFSRKVVFNLFSDRLEFKHNGKLFDEQDVKAISDILKGTKENERNQIGKFGIGFKSVFSFTSSPEIHSGEEHFIIEKYIRLKEAEPVIDIDKDETLFVFPFNHSEVSSEEVYEIINNKLKSLGSKELLFLKHIMEIEWHNEEGEEGWYIREVEPWKEAQRINIIGKNHKKPTDEEWLLFDHTVKKKGLAGSALVEIAFKLEKDKKSGKEYISPIEYSPMYVFFPTEKETHLGFLIQGPYRTTPARDNISRDDRDNKLLIEETAQLLGRTLSIIKDMGLLTVSFLLSLPLDFQSFTGYGERDFFAPFFNAVKMQLSREPLLPAYDRTYVSAHQSRLSRSEELRKLLLPEQLQKLCDSREPLYWLSPEISENRTPRLYSYLERELGINEIEGLDFARIVTAEFLQRQNDEWITQFYTFLSNQETLWRKGSSYSNEGPLRNKHIIRLENGKHITPFHSDGTAQVFLPPAEKTDFPTVKKSIASKEGPLGFLKALGLREPDIADEVIQKILHKYPPRRADDIDKAENILDIKKIMKALSISSHEKRESIEDELMKKPVVRSRNSVTKEIKYQRLEEVFINREAPQLFYEGNDNAWFICDYNDEIVNFFIYYGLKKDIIINTQSPDNGEDLILIDNHRIFQKAINGFDPDARIEGLEFALHTITNEKAILIWNEILLPFKCIIRGKVVTTNRYTDPVPITEERLSPIGELVTALPWIPIKDDNEFHIPSELFSEQLLDDFLKDDGLIEILGIKTKCRAALEEHAEQLGVELEDIELIRYMKHSKPQDYERFKRGFLDSVHTKPKFPVRECQNSEKRTQKVVEDVKNAPKKKYEKKLLSTRTSSPSIDKEVFLKSSYTNEEHQMICQICEEKMPFKKRSGDYYFEAVEIFSDTKPEYHELYIALCPLCAAKI